MTTKTNKIDLGKNITWDLSNLYTSETDPQIKKDINVSLEKAKAFEKKYKDKIKTLSPEQLKTAFIELETCLTPLYKAGQYASLRYSIETQNDTIKVLEAEIDDIESKVSNHLVFFSLELGSCDQDIINNFITSDSLKNYAYSIEHDKKTAAFNLSESEEKIITIKDISGCNGFKKLYGDLTTSFQFEFTIDGQKKTMTGSELRNCRYHSDPKVRREAMKLFYQRYEEHSITITHVFNNILKDYNNERLLRGYKTPISTRNSSNDLSDEAIKTLHDVTTKSNPLVQKYYGIKSSLLNLPDLTLADIYAPLPQSDQLFSYDEAKDLVLEAFASFDETFYQIAKNMFDENRIHAPIQTHKRGGAFCSSSTPDVYPYVMLNFQGKPRDVSTMAHELGHAIHSVLASKQTLTNYHAILPLAETASVFCEMIVTDLLLKRVKDNTTKQAILTDKCEDIFATSHRQNMFSLFEQATHEKLSTSILSAEEYCDIYKKGLQKVFGKAVVQPKEYQWEWATIPHFIDYPFYVYAYNFGNLLVFALYQQYKEEGVSFIPKLKEILSTGSALNPVDIAKIANADIQSEQFWKKSITTIETLIHDLESVI